MPSTFVRITTSGAQFGAALRSRAPEISIAFGQVTNIFLNKHNVLPHDIQRVLLTLAVDQDPPTVTYPLDGFTMKPGQAQLIKSIEAYILQFLLYHHKGVSPSAVIFAKLKMDDKTKGADT